MSAASLASYVIGKLSRSAPLETAGNDMTGRSRSASSTPRLTAVWRVKSTPYEIPVPNTSPFKEDGSLLRLLRAKSMPSLVREVDFTSRSVRVSSPTSFLTPGDRYTRSPSPSPLRSSLVNPRLSFDLGEGSDSTGASLITPMNSPRDESPAEHRKLTRSASDGHIWARRKTHLRDVRDEFPAGTLPSVKNLKIKFDRNLEGKPENNAERHGRTVSRKLPHSSSDEGDCPGGDTASQHVTTRRNSRHESLERWETDAVEVARLDLQKPRKSIGELKQRFEVCVSSTEDDTLPTTQLGIHQTNLETRVRYTEETSPPRKPITVESQSERKSRHRVKNIDGTARPRAKSEPNPSAIRRLRYEPSHVSVRKLKMQFEIQATIETDYSKKPVPIQKTSEQLPKTLPKEPSLLPTAVNMVSAQNIVKENEKERRFRSELPERSTQPTQVSIDSKITPSVKKLKKQFEEAVLAQYQGKSVERDDPNRPRTTIKSQLRTPFEGNNDSQESDNTKREADQAPAPQALSSTLVKDLLRQFETLSPEEYPYEGGQKFLFEQVPETKIEQKPPDDAKAAEVVSHTLAAKRLETESIFKVDEYSFPDDKESTIASKIEEIHKRSASSSDEILITRMTCNITDDAQERNQKVDDDWSKKEKEVKNESKEPKRITEGKNVQEHEKAEETTKDKIHNGQEKQQLEGRQRVEDSEKEETERKLKQAKPRECKEKEILQERKNKEKISQDRKKTEKIETQNKDKEKVKKQADEREEEVKPGRERKEKPEETKEKHRENGNEMEGKSQLTLDTEEWQESEEKVNLHIPSDKKEELMKGKSGSIETTAEIKQERQPEGFEDNGQKTSVFTDEFASTRGNECTSDQSRNVLLQLEDSPLQSSEHKVGQLIDRFTNLLDVDFDKLEIGQPQSSEDEERRLSDVAALVGKFAKLNKIRHSSSESDEASEGPTSAGKTEAAPIPTIPANTIPGKVRTLKADELRFFETGNTSEPFIRSQSLRTKKTEPPPFVKRRSGSMREKKSGNTLLPPEDSTNAAKALPRNCRPLRPDELRFFGMGNNNIYTVREVNTSKEEVKENKQESEFNQDFRLASQGNQCQHNGFPGDDQKPSTNYDSDSDSEASILRDCDSCDSDEIQLVDETIELGDTFKSSEETEISDCEENLSCEIKEIALMNTGTEELLEPVEWDQVGEENFLVFSLRGSTINEEYGLTSMAKKENGCATAVTENDASIYIREGTILETRSVTENTLQGAKGILAEAKLCRNGSGCYREMHEVSNREVQWTEKVTLRNIANSATVLKDFHVQIPPLPHVDTYSSGRGEFTEELGSAEQRVAQLKVESELIQFSENTSQDNHKNIDQLQQVTGYEAKDDAAHCIQETENNINDEPQRLYNIPVSVRASSNYEEELVTPEDACEREEEEDDDSENTSSDTDLGLVDEAFLKMEDEIDQETCAVPLSFEIDWLQPDLNKLTGKAERVKAEKHTNTVKSTPSFLHNAEDLLCLGGLSDDVINHDEQAVTDSKISLLGRERSEEVREIYLACSGKDEEEERIEDVYLECFDFSNEQHVTLFSLLVSAVTLMIALASNYFLS
ncbi:hypothetical protein OTU49_011817 [Cherax quadricarinatus]